MGNRFKAAGAVPTGETLDGRSSVIGRLQAEGMDCRSSKGLQRQTLHPSWGIPERWLLLWDGRSVPRQFCCLLPTLRTKSVAG